ncbi:multidrug transporter [Paucibacter sp. KBW04]|uniref:DMT family transporter n=1 Tax=Paucibacter sp. KBW04 TaxID=2153361 RepID=UPI000F5848C2|nr:DMT family transporter [Paucibacter sp. KBW04]RQO57344.1 multidrug transporter [Paucibacter sp. KBW04]
MHSHTPTPGSRWPALRGGLNALLAALLFGASTPLLQQLGTGLGSFSTAALLYAGAALVGGLLRQPLEREAALRRGDIPRLLLMAFFGALLGPVALAWGLQHTSGSAAALMLTLEAVFTALLARALYREQLDRRVAAALLLLTLGGVALIWDRAQTQAANHLQSQLQGLLGLLAVLAATAAWGLDNTLSRALANRDPGQVVLYKSALGANASAVLAWCLSEPLPGLWPALGLLAVGATGYGLSLRCYLLAQRAFGAARTASVFAFAPFFGAGLAYALGERDGGLWLLLGGLLMILGLLLHLAESHAHEHSHEAVEHEHAHRHDDGHHDHDHQRSPMPQGLHSHRHRHSPITHAHAHVPDEHHSHSH